MKLYRLFFLFAFVFSSISLSSQVYLKKDKPSDEGGNGDSRCQRECVTFNYTIFTSEAIDLTTINVTKNDVSGYGGDPQITEVNSVYFSEPHLKCSVYEYHISITICCDCNKNICGYAEYTIMVGEVCISDLPAVRPDCLDHYFHPRGHDVDYKRDFTYEENTDFTFCPIYLRASCCDFEPESPSPSDDDNTDQRSSKNENNLFDSLDGVMTVSPNPAVDVVSIGNISTDDVITILNLNGQHLLRKNVGNKNALDLDVSLLDSGIYLINRIGTDGEIQTQKFIKL